MIPLLTVQLRTEHDVVNARQRAREIAGLLGFDNREQIQIATATSEIARNAFRYARGGKASFSLSGGADRVFRVTIADSGAGIPNIDEILGGRYVSQTGLGLGLLGTRRLMDEFELSTGSSGTTVTIGAKLPVTAPVLNGPAISQISSKLAARRPQSAYEELDQQNQELLETLDRLRTNQEQLRILNHELEDTNRGVVALYAELDERADYLRRASEMKTAFLSNISHEFRTPLNSIISLARMLKERIDGPLSGEQEKQVGFIETSAIDLQEMVNDLLDLAKVEAGKTKLRVKSFEVGELFSGLKGMLKPLLADNRSVELLFEEGPAMPTLRTDEAKVSQILRNFISNAIKFTPSGMVRVLASFNPRNHDHNERAESSAPTEPETILFEVQDTGIGIQAGDIDKIFEEFVQVENPLQQRYRGTGLGLPLCRNLATLLGGRVWVESEPGRGSSFFAEIPIVYRGENPDDQLEVVAAPDYHRSPVLVIEDDANTFSMIEIEMRGSEFQLLHVPDMDRAMRWVKRNKPAAILMDVYLKGEASWPMLARLRESAGEVPIVAMSVHEEEQRAAAHGVSAFLRKPIARDVMLRELRRLTGNVRPKRVLIVDDNEVSRYILKEVLDRPWLDLLEARNGREALETMKRERLDAVILDLNMPEMNGVETLRRIREDQQISGVPVIIYTAKVLEEAERRELTANSCAIVRKDELASRLSADVILRPLAECGVAEPVR